MIERYRGPRRIRVDGDRLAALRTQRNLTLANVATVCGVSRQAVCQWEKEQSIPDDRALEGLAQIFGEDLNNAVSVKVWE